MSERDLFTAALHHGDPAAYLREACADDALRRRVEALLEAHRLAGAFLEGGPAVASAGSGLPPTAGASVLRALAAELPDLPRVCLRDPVTEDHTPVSRPGSSEMPEPALAAEMGRYHLVGEIARGGMGAVLKGRDTDLGRDVAVKVLLDAHKGKVEMVHRFVEEAQVGGQLQHPGIVPVYELGRFPDKRPFFAMKLVKGRTLSKLLRERVCPADELPRFVQVFAQVCQAVAYAHARGVIHRDLKPGNVMVGAFGEVQVMDWGLAKVLRQGGVADEPPEEGPTQIRTVRSAGKGSKSDTRAGSVLGTPAYMAPEQANAEVDRLDERADVFGLGAILCEVLTGQPPYTGQDGDAVYQQAAAADTAAALARVDGCGADVDLIALARHSLAADPLRRPRDAKAVAEAVTAYQESVAERLRRAELAQAAEAARAEEAKTTAVAERRARRLTAGLAAAVLLLVAAGATGGLWAQRQAAEREAAATRQRQAVEAALGKADELRQQARWAEARAILEETHNRLGESGPADLRRRIDQATADLNLIDRLEKIRLERATLVQGQFDHRAADRRYADAFRQAGLGEEGQPAEAVAARVRASAVAAHLVAALDDWAAWTTDGPRRAWLLAVSRRADPDPWRDRFRDPNVWGNRSALEGLAADLLRDPALLEKLKSPSLFALGNVLFSAKADAVPLVTAAQARYPNDYWLNSLLAAVFGREKNWDKALGYFRAALAVRPESAVVHNNLGKALHELKQFDAAAREFREAIRIDPHYALSHFNLGNALSAQDRFDESMKAYRTAIALDPKDARPHSGLGNALQAKGRLDEAIKEYRTAITLDPKDARPHINLGTALHAKGQFDEAVKEYCTAIALAPRDAEPHFNLGITLWKKGQLDEAVREFRAAIALRPDLAEAHCNLGLVRRAQGRYREALALLRRGHELGSKRPDWRYPSAEWVRQAERLAALEERLPAILKGEEGLKDAAERLALARLCQEPSQQLYAASSRFYAEAFAHDPRQAGDLKAQPRYHAARAAALAGTGRGKDDPPPDAATKEKLRRQALDWLRADLGAYAKLLAGPDPKAPALVRQRLQYWQRDPDFRGVRGDDALANLPEAERSAWRRLWADIEALLEKTR
jgi:serine/threonine-protein kinase